jgi:hypothetical protein
MVAELQEAVQQLTTKEAEDLELAANVREECDMMQAELETLTQVKMALVSCLLAKGPTGFVRGGERTRQ